VSDQHNKIIQSLFTSQDLDFLLFFGGPNIRYLCGFTGTDGVLLFSAKESVFLTDARYIGQAQQEVIAYRICCYKSKITVIVDELKCSGTSRVGFDAAEMTVAAFNELKRAAIDSVDWIPLDDQIKSLRAVKTPEELTFLRTAANLNYRAFQDISPLIRPGATEREIALELEFSLKRLGGEANAFDFIVAAGERGALPHGVASDRKIGVAELVTIDFGTKVNGYHSDETVTLGMGEVDRKLRQIFDIVLEAHDSALSAIKPGLSISALDAVARELISSRGYGAFFGHSLGHGVGLEVHEYPAVSARTEDVLLEGMVITVEPGIYLPDIGGVRIEDTVVVTANGFEALTSIPKQFMQVD
jgi:Xaa-Pro aminopeptidase